MKVRRVRLLLIGIGALALLIFAAVLMTYRALEPMPSGPPVFIRFTEPQTLDRALVVMQGKGVVRSAAAASIYAKLKRFGGKVGAGSYRFFPGMSVDQAFKALRRPISQMVRIPEGWWIGRVANLLEEKKVCLAKDYIDHALRAEEFKDYVKVPLPQSGSLEGYLYPDTYEMPPLLGAKEVIKRQLKAFERRIGSLLSGDISPHRILTIASMIELEVAMAHEKPVVAGVIENRLKKGMPLQIDATANYAKGHWSQLKPGEIAGIDSPYNTYKIRGLPPGPIGSPSVDSVKAAMNPASHGYLYYVALPDKTHLFSATYEQHLKNIRRRRVEIKRAGKSS